MTMLCCCQGTLQYHTQIQWRGNSSRDPHDIAHPDFNSCMVPLVWWPWWPFNMADWYIGSVSITRSHVLACHECFCSLHSCCQSLAQRVTRAVLCASKQLPCLVTFATFCMLCKGRPSQRFCGICCGLTSTCLSLKLDGAFSPGYAVVHIVMSATML